MHTARNAARFNQGCIICLIFKNLTNVLAFYLSRAACYFFSSSVSFGQNLQFAVIEKKQNILTTEKLFALVYGCDVSMSTSVFASSTQCSAGLESHS